MKQYSRIARAFAAALVVAGTAAMAAPTATLVQGVVDGMDAGNQQVFRNIPYAQPPVGSLRWKAPVPAGPFAGGRHNGADPAIKMCSQRLKSVDGTVSSSGSE